VCGVLPCRLNMALDHASWKCRKKPSLPCEKRITKQQEWWTNKWCYNALCIEILMIYGIININNHMNFVRYLDVFTIHSGVSFPLIVLIHVTWIVYMFVMYYIANWIWLWTMLVEKCRKKPSFTMWIENYQNTRMVNEQMVS